MKPIDKRKMMMHKRSKAAKQQQTEIIENVESAENVKNDSVAKSVNTQKNTMLLVVAIIVAAVVIALAITLPLVLTNRDPIWTDKLDPGDAEPIDVTSPAITLPAKPEVAPTTDKESPTTFGTYSISNDCYTFINGVEGESLFTVSYKSDERLPAYAYVYIPVTNYNGNPYLKIKADCDSVERLAVLAVYYEQYEQSRPAVAVYNNSVMDGENLFICKLNEGVLLDSHYSVVLGEKLTQKSICGFMLMIDSNPKQVIDEYSGEFTVTSIATVDENDPELNKLNAAPYIASWKASEGFGSCNIETSRIESADGMNAEIAYTVSSALYPRIEAAIANYKSDYTTVKMDIKGSNVKTLTIALKYSLKTSSDNIDYNYLSSFNMSVGSEWETLEFDFSTLEELAKFEGNTTVPGSYVKNLNPTAIYFFIDAGQNNSGTLSVRNVTFSKPEAGGKPRVTSTWSLGAQGITKSGVAEGGIGTLKYDKRQGWNGVTINVASYDPQYSVLVVKVKFYSKYSNLGIALGYGSENTVIQNSDGNTPTIVKLTHTEQQGEDDDGAYTFHTFTIDFSEAKTKNGEALSAQAITKIILYIDAKAQNSDGEWTEPTAGNPLKPARQMQFVGIEFQKPQQEQ